MMMSVQQQQQQQQQQKRKSSSEQEVCQQHHQPHQKLKRRRGKAAVTAATAAKSKEVTNAATPATGSDESVWIFGLINNIEQLLFNAATNGSSGSQSSGSSTPSSTTSTISSPSSLSTTSCPSSMVAALSSAPVTCGGHHQVPRSPISRQIKFHEYKGPPAAKRQTPATGSNRSQQQQQQPSGQTKLRVQAPIVRCKAPSRSHLAPHTSAAVQPLQQKLSLVQQQQPTCTIAKQQPHQSPQQQAHHQQSATNQLTSVVVAQPVSNSNATFSVLSPAVASAAHLQPQQQIVYGLADTSQAAIEQHQLCAQRQVMASQSPIATTRCIEQQQHQQQQLGDFELAMLQLAAAAAVDDDEYNGDKSTRSLDLGLEVPDQVEACQLEPSIAPFACSGVEELLFSEFIDLQDVPMNVDESDWLRKFLPPCNSLGSR